MVNNVGNNLLNCEAATVHAATDDTICQFYYIYAMPYSILVSLILKKKIRTSFSPQHIAATILNYILLTAVGISIYSAGQLAAYALKNQRIIGDILADHYILLVPVLLGADVILKFFFKKVDFSLFPLQRFPNLRSKLRVLYIVRELTSPWNLYWLLFFYPILLAGASQDPTYLVLCLVAIYSVQLLNSLVSTFLLINRRLSVVFFTVHFTSLLFFLTAALPLDRQGINYLIYIGFNVVALAGIVLLARKIMDTLLYLSISSGYTRRKATYRRNTSNPHLYFVLFNLKMIGRSPILRRHFIVLLGLAGMYTYIFATKPDMTLSPMIRFALQSFLFSVYPILFGQYLFSAESSFFDKLMVMPALSTYFQAKYLLAITFIAISTSVFVAFVHAVPYLEVVAVFLFSAGPITMGTFCAVLFANTRLDLQASTYNIPYAGLSSQAWIVALTYLFNLLLVVAVYRFVPYENVYIYFMIVTGAGTILFAPKLLRFILENFLRTKYTKLNAFRK